MKTHSFPLSQEQGFSLLELLVVLTITAALAAVAIPQYSTFRARAFDTRALSDLRNVAIAEEANFIDSEKYLTCKDAACEALPGIGRLSKGVSLGITALETQFTGQASHFQGTGRVFRWDSEMGGLQE